MDVLSPAPVTTPESQLVYVNAPDKIRKRTDTVVAFTQEYSRVSYLSSGKQRVNNLIIDSHASTNIENWLN